MASQHIIQSIKNLKRKFLNHFPIIFLYFLTLFKYLHRKDSRTHIYIAYPNLSYLLKYNHTIKCLISYSLIKLKRLLATHHIIFIERTEKKIENKYATTTTTKKHF